MQNFQPGWYPDPEGGRQVRFWDGDAWTEYTQPLAPEEAKASGGETAVADYPYLDGADLIATHEPRIVSSWDDGSSVGVIGAPPRRRTSRAWWITAGVAAVVLVLAIALLRPGNSSDPVLADPSPSSTVTATTSVTVGEPVEVDVPASGTSLVTIDIASDGAYFVAATSPDDIAMELLQDGTTIWQGDDRGAELVQVTGGSWSDPATFIQLSAGQYQASISEREGATTSAEVSVYTVEATDITLGEPLPLSIAATEYAVLRLTLESESALVVDVRADGPVDDARLTTFQTGEPVTTDDRTPSRAAETGGSEYDPYLEATFPAGVSFLVIDEYSQAPFDLTVTVTPQP